MMVLHAAQLTTGFLIVAGISGKLGKNAFSFGYRGQVANPSANPAATPGADTIQAIDRSVALSTDPSPKAPLVVAGSVSGTSYTDTTVSPGTSYTYAVRARDAAGNVSIARRAAFTVLR